MYVICPTLDKKTATKQAQANLSKAGLKSGLVVVEDVNREGWTKTVNRGWADDDLCILNDDCVCPEGWLLALWDALLSRSQAGFAGPSGACRTAPQSMGRPGDTQDPRFVSHLAGFCLMIKRRVAQSGKLDEAFVHYGSDTAYQWEARRKLGVRSLWVPRVYICHELHAPHQPWYKRDNELFRQRWL